MNSRYRADNNIIINEDEFDNYVNGIFERLKSINADMDDIEGKVTNDRLFIAFYSNVDKKESSKFRGRAEKLIMNYLENETRFNDWIEIYITPADKFFYNTYNDNLKSFAIEIKAESSQDFNQYNKSLDEAYVEDLVVGKKYYFTNRGEVYHAKFKEKTPTWLIFVDDDGETIYTNHWVDISTSKKDLSDTPDKSYEKDSENKKSKKDFEIDDKEVAEISDDDKKKEFKDKANAIISKVISGVKSCGGTIRNIDRKFDEDLFRLTIVCSVSETKEDSFEDTIELSIKSNLREFISAKDLTISIFNKMALKDNNINYYISIEGKGWRSKLTEANELKQRAKKHSKKQKGMSPFTSLDAGNVEKGIEMFNAAQPSGSVEATSSLGEGLETYHYDGPTYYAGHKISDKEDIYTKAVSAKQARNNILYRLAGGDRFELLKYDIVPENITLIKPLENQKPNEREHCPYCHYELNDMGDCPVCDYGEDDLMEENLSSIEALHLLN